MLLAPPMVRLSLLGAGAVFLLLCVSCDQGPRPCPNDGSVPGCFEDSDLKLQNLILGPVVGPLPPPPTAISLLRPAAGQQRLILGPATADIPHRGLATPTPASGSLDTPAALPQRVAEPTAAIVPQPEELPASLSDSVASTPEPTPLETPTPLATPTIFPTTSPVPLPSIAANAVPSPTIPVPSPTPTVSPVPEPLVRISLEDGMSDVLMGQEFQVEVRVWASPYGLVDAAQVYLVFDSRHLQLASLSPGKRLEYELQSQTDNEGGLVACAAGTLQNAAAAPFALCTLTFLAISATGPEGTVIGFAPLAAPRETKAVFQGMNVTGELATGRVLVR